MNLVSITTPSCALTHCQTPPKLSRTALGPHHRLHRSRRWSTLTLHHPRSLPPPTTHLICTPQRRTRLAGQTTVQSSPRDRLFSLILILILIISPYLGPSPLARRCACCSTRGTLPATPAIQLPTYPTRSSVSCGHLTAPCTRSTRSTTPPTLTNYSTLFVF